MQRAKFLFGGFFFITLIVVANLSQPSAQINAQDNTDDVCDEVVTEAFQIVGSACVEMRQNEACFGHIDLDATFRIELPPPFDTSGDVVENTQLESITTHPLDLDTGTWGIALMTVQADLPDDAKSPMTLVLMGDTRLEQSNKSIDADVPTCEASNTNANNINVRLQPDTNSSIIATIPPNSSLTINGRHADSDWVHVVSDDSTGWIFAPLLTFDCDVDTLAVVDGESQNTPTQSFTLHTSPSGTCETVPDGLLIRSPEGQRARIIVNGVELVFSSVGYLATPSDDILSIQGLEGQIAVTSDGQTETITPDFFTTIPLTNLEADGPPTPPQPIADEHQVLLPILDTASDIASEVVTDTFDAQACMVETNQTVNLRSGPGTNYAIEGQLTQADSSTIAGQATGSNGFVWWQLTTGEWVRSDLVDTIGVCSDIPQLTPPPAPPPNPNARGSSFAIQSGSWRYVETIIEDGCGNAGGQLVYDDMRLEFSPDGSTMTETSTTGPYSFYGGTMSITYAHTTGTTYVFSYVGEPYDNTTTLTFTSATTATGESYFPPGPNSCGTRWRIVATKN